MRPQRERGLAVLALALHAAAAIGPPHGRLATAEKWLALREGRAVAHAAGRQEVQLSPVPEELVEDAHGEPCTPHDPCYVLTSSPLLLGGGNAPPWSSAGSMNLVKYYADGASRRNTPHLLDESLLLALQVLDPTCVFQAAVASSRLKACAADTFEHGCPRQDLQDPGGFT